MINISQERKDRAANALKENSINITVDWDSVYVRNGSQVVTVKCNKCREHTYQRVSLIVKGIFDCKSCTVNKYTALLKLQGFRYLSHKQGKISVFCEACSTIGSAHTSSITKGFNPVCQGCLIKKYTTLADKVNFDFIRKTVKNKSTRITIKCRSDGVERTVGISELAEGTVRCSECMITRYKIALSKRGCKFIHVTRRGRDNPAQTKIKYRAPNGEVFEVCSSNLLTGVFSTNKEGHWYSPHKTYLIHLRTDNTDYCKIGTSNDPQRRMEHLQLKGEAKVYTIAEFDNRFEADKLESELHSEFAEHRLDKAVAESFTSAIKLVKRAGSYERVPVTEGSTEWFTHRVYDLLKQKYILEESHNGTITHTTGTSTHTRQ